MIVCGVDVGSTTTKSVILEDGKIVGYSLIPTSADSAATSFQTVSQALYMAKRTMKDIEYTVSTGYGRVVVPFAQTNITEITCHARGILWFYPETHTLLDLGGQDCKAIRLDDLGNVMDFILNDKCAAGTGRYLERVAKTLDLKLEEIGTLSLKPIEGTVVVSSFCTVYAQNDINLLIRAGKHVNDVLAGAFDALVDRIVLLLQRIGVVEMFSMSGGIARNIGVVKRLEERLGVTAHIPPRPQIVGALGAALLATSKLQNLKQ